MLTFSFGRRIGKNLVRLHVYIEDQFVSQIKESAEYTVCTQIMDVYTGDEVAEQQPINYNNGEISKLL